MRKNDLIYGIHAVDALLNRQPERVIEIYTLKGRVDKRLTDITNKAQEWGLSVQQMHRKSLDEKSNDYIC